MEGVANNATNGSHKNALSQNSTDTNPKGSYQGITDFLRTSFGSQPVTAVKVEPTHYYSQPQTVSGLHGVSNSSSSSSRPNKTTMVSSGSKRNVQAENAPHIDPQKTNQAWNKFKSVDLPRTTASAVAGGKGGYLSIKPVHTTAIAVDLTESEEEEEKSLRRHLPTKPATLSSQRSSSSSSVNTKRPRLP